MAAHRQFGLGQYHLDLFSRVGREKEWRRSGEHYRRTALDWLAKMRIVMRSRLRCGLYDDDTALWMRRWPWFFLATAGLFGPAGGAEWGAATIG